MIPDMSVASPAFLPEEDPSNVTERSMLSFPLCPAIALRCCFYTLSGGENKPTISAGREGHGNTGFSLADLLCMKVGLMHLAEKRQQVSPAARLFRSREWRG